MESVDSSHKHLVLYSGGPDSYITHHEVRRMNRYAEVIPIYFNLGHRYASNEIHAVYKTLPRTVIDRSFSSLCEWEQEDAFIFARNALLLTGMSRYVSGPATLYLSVQKDELSLADRQPVFMDAMTQLLGVLGLDVSVESPWLALDKTDMVKHFVSTGGSEEKLTSTWSCYSPVVRLPEVIHCGDCPACVRRYIAFTLGFGKDRTVYATPPAMGGVFQEYTVRAAARAYSEDRCARIMEAARC